MWPQLLQKAELNAERHLWELGKIVSGWGRIQIVDRLAGTQDEEIKGWLLRDAYRNDIMGEYTALICARTGSLLEALRGSELDDALLTGAGQILRTLIDGRGGPAEAIESYPEGAEVAELYLRTVRGREADLATYNVVVAIDRFLAEEEGEAREARLGWPRYREVLLEHIDAIRARPDWEDKIWRGLSSTHEREFWEATQAAKAAGIDIWDVFFNRLVVGEDRWYQVMQTDDASRIDRVVQLAEERLPLAHIAAGPADELGTGPGFEAHGALDFVLQDLSRFPGKGWPLIRTGLQSPVTRNRNMAIKALASWSREEWPDEAEALVMQAFRQEPNQDSRELLRKLLVGEK